MPEFRKKQNRRRNAGKNKKDDDVDAPVAKTGNKKLINTPDDDSGLTGAEIA